MSLQPLYAEHSAQSVVAYLASRYTSKTLFERAPSPIMLTPPNQVLRANPRSRSPRRKRSSRSDDASPPTRRPPSRLADKSHPVSSPSPSPSHVLEFPHGENSPQIDHPRASPTVHSRKPTTRPKLGKRRLCSDVLPPISTTMDTMDRGEETPAVPAVDAPTSRRPATFDTSSINTASSEEPPPSPSKRGLLKKIRDHHEKSQCLIPSNSHVFSF